MALCSENWGSDKKKNVFLLKKHVSHSAFTCSSVSIVNFEQVNTDCDVLGCVFL